jgi:CheY-like chemotaxis protein
MDVGALRGIPALIVDDNSTNRRILGDILIRWGMQPYLATGGAEALEILEDASHSKSPVRLVLSDVNMPDMDGFTLAERIRESPALRSTSIIILSSGGQRGDAARCRALGVAGYLTKPVRQRDLQAAVGAAFAQLDAGSTYSKTVTSHSLRESRRKLRVLVVEDNPINQRLACRLIERSGHIAETATDGREAVRQVGSLSFDLVLMDIQMPVMDGLEATRSIRALEASGQKRQLIVAMTANAMQGDRELCITAGMDGYISKPIQTHQLTDLLERVEGAPPDSEPAAILGR